MDVGIPADCFSFFVNPPVVYKDFLMQRTLLRSFFWFGSTRMI